MNESIAFPIVTSMAAACSSVQKENMNFKPERISKSATIHLNGRIEDVFPLFGPVREKDWAEGWSPEIIYPDDIPVEEHMIFKTKAYNAEEDGYYWCVTQFNPEEYLIEYTVSTAQRMWFIRVQCKAENETTTAHVSYTYTGLSEKGNELNKQALKRMFAYDLKDWGEAINHYLTTGTMLVSQHKH